MTRRWMILVVAACLALLGLLSIVAVIAYGRGKEVAGKDAVSESEVVQVQRTDLERRRQVWQSLRDLTKQLHIRSASVVGDSDSKVYHRFPVLTQLALSDSFWREDEGRPAPTFIPASPGALPQFGKLFASDVWPHAMGVCPELGSVASPVYFSSELAATKAGYWPCPECGESIFTYTTTNAVVRDSPQDVARVSYRLPAGTDVRLLAKHADFYGISSERRDTGETFMGWVAARRVRVDKCGFCEGKGWSGEPNQPEGICHFCFGHGRARVVIPDTEE